MAKKLIIIGGGFAGTNVAKQLENSYKTTLIDSKSYFEYTPGILRTIVEPTHVEKIQSLHSHYLKKTKIITNQVQEIGKDFVRISKEKIKFDYLVIASGSSYDLPIKEENIILPTRAKHLKENYKKLQKAKNILIIGGGLVGIELAAEIITHYKNKKLTIINYSKKLVPRSNNKAIEYATNFLKKKNVELILGEKFETSVKNSKFDIIFTCTGITPNFKLIKRNFPNSLSKRNYIKVNKYLQLKNSNNIFVAGDVTNIKEEKTAQRAKKHAEIVIKNIVALDKNQKMYKYKSSPNIMVMSLGKYDGILEYKNFTLTGLIPAVLKILIEKIIMRKYG